MFYSRKLPSRGRLGNLIIFLLFTIFLFLTLKSLHVGYPNHLFKTPSTFIWNNEQACADSTDDAPILKNIVIVVSSARSHFEERQLIRETWGSISHVQNWTILGPLFMIGESSPGEPANISTSLDLEHDVFGDFVKGDFMDTYRNLTLKTIMAHQWLVQFCPTAHVVVKTDDDVIVNIFKLIENLNKMPNIESTSRYLCRLNEHDPPLRDNTSKWYIPLEDYAQDKYPPFCSGACSVMSMKAVKRVVEALDEYTGKLIFLEDVFMSGILPAAANSKRVQVDGQLSLEGGGDRIVHVDRRVEWYYYPENRDGRREDLNGWLTSNSNSSVDGIVNKFNQFVFFVIDREPLFSQKVIQLWDKIVQINLVF